MDSAYSSKAAALVAAAVAASAAAAALLAVRGSKQELQYLQRALAHEQEKRAADRAGRIRAEQKLKQLNLQLAAQVTVAPSQAEGVPSTADADADARAATTKRSAHPSSQQHSSSNNGGQGAGSGGSSSSRNSSHPVPLVFPFASIGYLRSCFNDRRGTPRQPHLVPAARSVLQLSKGVPSTCLTGLEGFSHCWILYVFHENTDLAKVLAARPGPAAAAAASSSNRGSSAGAGSSHIKAMISVPRLNGAKMGVFATRSPHRPVPVGLSTAEVVRVDPVSGVLVLGGVDIVDGSPVLDIKPYVPFSDALTDATAPPWVAAAAEDEPLALAGVDISAAAMQALHTAWQEVRQHSLYHSADEFVELVQQVLTRDIRSLHQRKHVAPVAEQQPGGQPPWQGDGRQQQQQPTYTVTLDGVQVCYNIDAFARVTVLGASVTLRDAYNARIPAS